MRFDIKALETEDLNVFLRIRQPERDLERQQHKSEPRLPLDDVDAQLSGAETLAFAEGSQVVKIIADENTRCSQFLRAASPGNQSDPLPR